MRGDGNAPACSPSETRVRAALSFGRPDRVPRYDSFWPEFTEVWRHRHPSPDATPEDVYGIDLVVVAADETPWPSRAGVLSHDGEETLARDGWGRLVRTRRSAMFSETVGVALADRSALAGLEFESPLLPGRYERFAAAVAEQRARRAVFAKTGGPFLRTAFVRGEVDYLMDMAADEGFAEELTARVTDHLIAVGVESLRRGGEMLTGIFIYDDIASNAGPMMSPRTYERLFLPQMSRMVAAYKAAGADYVVFHSDGNINPILPMLIEAGIEAVQPIEPKAGMDVVDIRRRYGDKLALIGGLDNAFVLPSGDRDRIRESVLYALQAGRDGGLILGSHSIGPDVPVAAYEYLVDLQDNIGRYPLQW